MIDIEIARTFLKADGEDDDLITRQIASATNICEDYCNRKFYANADAQEDDFVLALNDYNLALSNRSVLLDSYSDSYATRSLIRGRYIEIMGRITQRINGIVIDDAIEAAILITLGHLYKNREDNLATGNNVVQLPVGAQRILQSKLWIGSLVDSCDGS